MLREKLGTIAVLSITIMCGLLGIFAISSLVQYYMNAENTRQNIEDVAEVFHSNDDQMPETTDTMDPEYLAWLNDKWDEMYALNNDYAFWLVLDGLDLEYPVCYSRPDDEYFYLHHDFNGNSNSNGCLYLSPRCTEDSDNFIIYGHRMHSGNMFGSLGKYQDEEWALNNRLMQVYLRDEHRFYEVIAVFTVDADNPTVQWEALTDFSTASQCVGYGLQVTNASDIDFGYTPGTYADRYLTLVTCEYTHSNGRLIVVARELGTPRLDEIDDTYWEDNEDV